MNQVHTTQFHVTEIIRLGEGALSPLTVPLEGRGGGEGRYRAPGAFLPDS